jgi:hypothetical protein
MRLGKVEEAEHANMLFLSKMEGFVSFQISRSTGRAEILPQPKVYCKGSSSFLARRSSFSVG